MSSNSSTTNSSPEIYVACLASYNAGKLYGAWIDATIDAADIKAQIQQMLANSDEPIAEDWAIHSYEGFYGADLGEHPDIEEIATAAKIIDEYGEVAAGLISHFESRVEEAIDALENKYAGEHESLADYAEEISEASVTDIPEHIARYIDYEAMGRDLELGGDIFTIQTEDGRIHIFWNH